MEVDAKELSEILQNKITLYEHLGIEALEISSSLVRFRVSLQKNRNHKGTAFGGSLYSAAVLAAYALVLAGLKARNIPTDNIVIAKGEIQYLRPIDTDFEVVCQFESPEQENKFYEDLKLQGRVKGPLRSQIRGGGGSLGALLTGVFVVKL